MKIILLNPPIYDQRRYGKPLIYPYSPPVNIAYLASILKEHHDVAIYDLFRHSWKRVREILEKEDPDVVGITCLTEQRASPLKLARLVKSINEKTKVVFGGIHPTILYNQVLEHYPVDVVVLGEGEETVRDLIRAFEKEENLGGVAGIAFRRDGSVVKTEDRRLIQNLDSIPFPAYEFFDFDAYERYEILKGRFKGRDLKQLRFVSIVASRGCVGTCQFCSTPWFWGRRWRKRSAKNVVDEMELLANEYQCEFFNFADDIFTVDKKWVVAICQEIIDRRLDIIWDCETRVNYISEDLLGRMRDAGCYCISYGVESASSDVLDEIGKKATPDQIEKAFRLTHQIGVKTKMLLMIGNPGESDKSVDDTVRMIEMVEPDFVSVSETMVFPGTALYELARSKGLVDDDYWLSDRPAPYYTVEHDLEQLFEWSNRIMTVRAGRLEKSVRKIRDAVERVTGIRVSRGGLEFTGSRKEGL